MLVFGASRKILFKRYTDLINKTNQRIREKKMDQLGNVLQDIQLIECHPKLSDVLASVSGNNVLIWDLN